MANEKNEEINHEDALKALETQLGAGVGDAASAEAVTKSLGLVGSALELLKSFSPFGKSRQADGDKKCGKCGKFSKGECCKADAGKDDGDLDDDDEDLDEETRKALGDRVDLTKAIDGKDVLDVTAVLDTIVNEQRQGLAAVARLQKTLRKSLTGQSDSLAVAMDAFVRTQNAVNATMLKSLEVLTKQQEAFFARVPTTGVRGVPGALDMNLDKALGQKVQGPYSEEQLLKGIQAKKINLGHVKYYRTTGKLPDGITLD